MLIEDYIISSWFPFGDSNFLKKTKNILPLYHRSWLALLVMNLTLCLHPVVIHLARQIFGFNEL